MVDEPHYVLSGDAELDKQKMDEWMDGWMDSPCGSILKNIYLFAPTTVLLLSVTFHTLFHHCGLIDFTLLEKKDLALGYKLIYTK